jgi:5'-3' exonuclease
MLEAGVTHIGVATDHVIESFRNGLWPGYKNGAGVDPRLLQQFPLLEDGLRALGVATWPMVELEADDGLASAARLAVADSDVGRVLICSPDKDLAQCVRDGRVVLLDRRKNLITDAEGVVARFGVAPASIPDYLALVGDSADGFPGLPGWGPRAAATLLALYGSIDAIPPRAADWQVSLRGAERLAATLREQLDLALLFRDLATLRDQEPLFDSVDKLRWRGPAEAFEAFSREVDGAALLDRARAVARLRTV